MTNSEIEKICELVEKGAKISIGRAPNGARRIKLTRGLFGLLVERYSANEADVTEIKQRLHLSVH